MAQVPRERRAPYRRPDVAVAFVSLAMLAAVLAPALAQTRENNARVQCLNNVKYISIAIANFESARKTMPLASTQPITGKPAHAGDVDAAGFSWLVMVLTTLQVPGAQQFLDPLMQTSDQMRKQAFDPAVTSTDGANNVPSRDFPVSMFLCPSYLAALDGPVDDVGKLVPVPKRPAISNYHVLAGSQFFNKEGIGRMVPAESLVKGGDGRVTANVPYEGSGVMPFPGVIDGKPTARGLKVQQVSDGMAHTITFAETVESKFANWLDGQVTWLVAAWPGNPDLPSQLPPARPTEASLVGWTPEQLPKNWTSLGKQWSPNAAEPTPPYLSADRWSGGQNRLWGPSSYHGNSVAHGFADAHAQMISVDVDKNVYLHLVTRAGRENVDPGKY